MSILWKLGDHILDGGYPSLGWQMTIHGMVADHPWQLSPGVSFVSNVYVPNFMSVVHFLLWVTILMLGGDHP